MRSVGVAGAAFGVAGAPAADDVAFDEADAEVTAVVAAMDGALAVRFDMATMRRRDAM